MIAALATLVFLLAIGLAGAVAVQMLSSSGAKIVAALKGQSLLASEPTVLPVSVRVTRRSVARANPRPQMQWRAAA